jgi:GNAT superfamily N-acetyltransferase
MQAKDADAAAALIARNLREVNSREYPPEYIEAIVRANGPDALLTRMQTAHMYVVCENDTVLGCGAVQTRGETECLLLTVFVLPELHGKGIGRAIMQALEADEYAMRARRITLHASVSACDFYVKLGYAYQGGARTIDADGCIHLEKLRANG